MLIDKIHLTVQGGHGGHGCDSYYHRIDRKIVPNGADGGDGGSVIFRASHNAPGLDRLKLKQYLVAPAGTHGGPNNKRGACGEDLVVLVPVGTSIYNKENRLAIRDLNQDQDEVVVARGGRGGSGNIGDKKATPGQEGEKLEIELEFLIPADVFLVGLPSTGKSALMHRLTKAHVEGKDYPFSTTSPVLGVYECDDYSQISLCELPSVFEGSTQGRGLGTQFLKHLARGKLVLYMLDATNSFAPSLTEGYHTLRKLVWEHNPAFKQIPSVAVVNKIDLADDPGKVQEEMEKLERLYFLISVKTGEGIKSLVDFIKEQTGHA
ncbi:MAG: GTPase Obg [Candidatus Omnitrophica bacterium ADurb.Bin292]|jgi:GTP-binding protein|nr:MAG: GTPase Obg [Candidatus Omnitrophica bacterium ADurb.Bin292]HPW76745.1 50S ribosome-binding GTPase [Candidatus Omnitrophota bacterium]HQB11738.1 50S ribosome-binding GTPase [Candidatus Omnitrophota bacterium]